MKIVARKQLVPLGVVLISLACGQQLFSQEKSNAQATGSGELRVTGPVLISDKNRKQNGAMFGGWGPHLRSILRMNDDSLWHVIDHSKVDIGNNDQLFYYQQNDNAWNQVAEQDLIRGANQGYAHITNGEEIFSYGVNFRLAELHECRLNTKSLQRHECTAVRTQSGQVVDLGGGANYVGAAISPAGTKLVWWVVVARDGTGYQWRYIYNRGDGWQGPITTPLEQTHGALSYIYVRFINENQVALSGQVWVGKFPEGNARAVLSHFTLGKPIQGFHTLTSPDDKGFPKSGSDLWVNSKSSTVHAFVEGFGDSIHYYTFNPKAPWQELQPTQSLQGYFRARLTETIRGDLFLILGGNANQSKMDVLHVPVEQISNSIDWSSAKKHSLTMPATEHYAPGAIWVENRAYQTTPVRTLNFAFTGQYPQKDNEIWFYSASE